MTDQRRPLHVYRDPAADPQRPFAWRCRCGHWSGYHPVPSTAADAAREHWRTCPVRVRRLETRLRLYAAALGQARPLVEAAIEPGMSPFAPFPVLAAVMDDLLPLEVNRV